MTARTTLLTNDPQTPYDQQLLTAMLADPRTWGEASHVLPKLLTRDDLAPPVVSAISTIARVWLTDNPTAPHASFVISPLLGRDDLTPDDAADTIRLVLEWLTRLLPGPHAADTGRVLCALLRRRDTPMAELLPTLERWISHHGLCSDAALVYKSVFTGKSIPPSAPVRAVEWLEAASENAEIDRVADYLLTLRELADPDWRRGAQVVLRWLARAPLDEYRGYTLTAVARRLQLLTPEQHAVLAAESRRFLAAGFTVPPQIEDRLHALVKHIEEGRERLSLPHATSFQGAIDAVEADLAAGRTPTSEALRRLLDMAEKRTARSPEAAGYAAPCLLAGAARCGPPVADEVERWAAALWTALTDTPRARDGLRSAIRRRQHEGWWPAAPPGIAAMIIGHGAPGSSQPTHEIGPRATDALKQAIAPVEAALFAGRSPTAESLRELLARAEERRLRAPESAGYAGPALLAGAAHQPELAADIERWAAALWAELADAPRAREGLRYACHRQLSAGWWPGPPQGITATILNSPAPLTQTPHAPRPRRIR